MILSGYEHKLSINFKKSILLKIKTSTQKIISKGHLWTKANFTF